MTEPLFTQHIVKINIPEDVNIIFGQSHFVKTVEDIYEAMITASPSIKFGVAFCEASQKRLVRSDGNDSELTEMAEQAAFSVGCGHCFFIFMKESFPINVLGRIRQIDEVCHIYCATANPLEVIVAETSQGRGVIAVIDGSAPKGIETEPDKNERQGFLRTIGYKR